MSGSSRSSTERLAPEGGSVVVDLPARLLLRSEPSEEGGDLAGAIRRQDWPHSSGFDECTLGALLLAQRELLRGEARPVALQLGGVDHREDCAQPLVLHDGALVDATAFVERRERKKPVLAADLDSTVLPLVDADALARERQRVGAWLDEIADPLEMDD